MTGQREQKVDEVIISEQKQGELETLSNEQLCELYQLGEEKALEMLITKNERLVYSRVKKYANMHRHKLEFEDLLSYGREGIMIAARKYELNRNSKFATYCTFWIDQKVMRAIYDYGFTIRFPVHLFEVLRFVIRAQQQYTMLSDEELVAKIVAERGISESKVRQVMALKSQLFQLPSLNMSMTDEGETELIEVISDDLAKSPEEELMSDELQDVLYHMIQTLNPKEQEVLYRRYGLKNQKIQTLEEIGISLGVTRERIRQIEVKALEKLAHPSRNRQLVDFINSQSNRVS